MGRTEQELIRVGKEHLKKFPDPDYGTLWWNPDTKSVYYIVGDSAGGYSEAEKSFSAVKGVRDVEIADEGGKPSDPRFIKLKIKESKFTATLKSLHESNAINDSDYIEALSTKSAATVKQMVSAAARQAGYNYGPVFHSSTYGEWTVFNTRAAFGKAGYGSYFSNENGARLFAEYGERFQMPQNYKGVPKNVRILSCFLRIKNPFNCEHVDSLKPHLDRDQAFGVHAEFQKIKPPSKTRLEALGYDAIITAETTAPRIHKTRGLSILKRGDPKGVEFPVVVVFDASQIKLSDPVTYDDNGDIIPLSKRFDPNNPDIRY